MDEAVYTGEKVEIIPNYTGIMKMFLRDFAIHSQGLRHLDTDTHERMHSILASLNVAAQGIDSADSLEAFRNELSRVVTESCERLNQKRQAEEEESNCICDYPSALGGHHSYCFEFKG